jgi:O-antigen/teichoic acid export membrane protein
MIRAEVASLWRNEKLKQNTVLATASTGVSMLVGLVSAPILAWLLPREDYGALSYVNSLQGLILAFSAPGVANAIAYSVARGYEGTFRTGTYYRLRLYMRNSLLMLPLAGWYLWMEKNPSMALLVALGGLLLSCTYAFDTGEQFLVGRWDFAAIFWRRVTSSVLMAASGIAAAYLIPTALSVFLGRGIVTAAVTLGIFLVLLRSVRNDDADPEFWAKSRDFGQISILGAIGSLTDRLVLGKSGALSRLAGYSVAVAIAAPLNELSKSFIKIAFGKMAQPQSIERRRLWLMFSLLVVLIGIPLSLLGWQVVLPLILMLFPKYPELAYLVPPLLIGSVLGFGANLGQTYGLFHSYDLWRRYNLIRNASRIPITAAAVLLAGVWGAVYATVGYSLADCLVYNILLWRRIASY